MIYLWRQRDGSLGMASDSADRATAVAADMIDNWEPGSNLNMMIDTAQIVARRLGLWENQWDRSRKRGEPMPAMGQREECVFPHGPLCLPCPEPGDTMEETTEKIRQGWRRARVIEQPEGPYCTPLPRSRRIAR